MYRMKKRLIIGCLMAAATNLTATAQSSTKSPYSQFGFGVLSDPSQAMSRGMNGVGTALRSANQVNTLNPASYTAVDSLTMIFDASVTGQLTNFSEGNVKQNGKTAAFDYVIGQFRALPGLGVTVGVLPLSNIGYQYSSSTLIDQTNGKLTETFSGEGGLHQVFIGVGWRVVKPLSVGFNAGYVWGSIDRAVLTAAASNINTMRRVYSATVNSYKLDAGVQWDQPLGRRDRLTLGATVGIGHKLGADPELQVINVTNADTTSYTAKNALELPWSYSVGAALNHNNRLTVAADVTMQQWGKTRFPAYESADNSYAARDGLMKDRMKVNVGAEWIPNPMTTHSYLSLVRYRIGVGYATPYYNINGKEGPKELSASIGLGLPIINSFNSRSTVNVSAQWARSSATGLITENTFRLTVGITFNERWFAKWKVE